MNRQEIIAKAEYSIGRAKRIPNPDMGNYKQVLATYKAILDDILEMILALAKDTPAPPTVTIEVSGETTPGN